MSTTHKQHFVTSADLPVCCPQPRDPLWDMHPRVYLPIEETGQAICPYCSAEFILTDAAHTSAS